MILGFDFDFMRILLAGGMLSIASLLDLRRREVSDLLWIVFGAMAAVIYFLEFVSSMTFDVVAIALPICISAASSYGIYRSGLFGGADALALVTLAVILPTFSGGLIEQVITNRHAFLLHPVAPIIVLSNTIIFSMSQILLNLGRNATYVLTKRGRLYQGLEQEPLIRKVFSVLIGYKT